MLNVRDLPMTEQVFNYQKLTLHSMPATIHIPYTTVHCMQDFTSCILQFTTFGRGYRCAVGTGRPM